MKNQLKGLRLAVLMLISCLSIYCTKATVTPVTPPADVITKIIVVRHAEKDPAGGNDPSLSPEGTARAQRLQASFPNTTPDAFYSTNYIRTKSTLQPWASATQKAIEIYDATKLPEFADLLKQQKGKTIVVAGHSNTVPPLVNLLIGEEKYQNLNDSEYDKIFVVTITNNNPKSEIKTY